MSMISGDLAKAFNKQIGNEFAPSLTVKMDRLLGVVRQSGEKNLLMVEIAGGQAPWPDSHSA